MNQATYKINTDIVSTTMKDKPLIFISEEAINLKRDNDNLKSIIKEVREWAKKYSCQFTNDDGELVVSEISFNIQARPCDLFKILDKEK